MVREVCDGCVMLEIMCVSRRIQILNLHACRTEGKSDLDCLNEICGLL